MAERSSYLDSVALVLVGGGALFVIVSLALPLRSSVTLLLLIFIVKSRYKEFPGYSFRKSKLRKRTQ